MIIYLALEDLDQRYTNMMNTVVSRYVDVVLRGTQYGKIASGQFLDTFGTSRWKSEILTQVAEMFMQGKIKDGDKFFVSDLFWPGLESIKYMAELADIDVKIYGYSHAGITDPVDFVNKLGDWVVPLEYSWYQMCEKVFVGSEFHKRLILEKFSALNEDGYLEKIIVTGAPWDLNYVDEVYPTMRVEKSIRAKQVVMASRLSWEKGYGEFLDFAIKHPDIRFFITSGKRGMFVPKNVKYAFDLSKRDYYKLLSQSEWFVSFSYQETFGYSLQEAIAYGCKIAVPNRACYPEMVPHHNLYNNIKQLEAMLQSDADYTVPFEMTNQWNDNVIDIMRAIKK